MFCSRILLSILWENLRILFPPMRLPTHPPKHHPLRSTKPEAERASLVYTGRSLTPAMAKARVRAAWGLDSSTCMTTFMGRPGKR